MRNTQAMRSNRGGFRSRSAYNSRSPHKGSFARKNNRGSKSRFGQYIDPNRFIKAAKPTNLERYVSVNQFSDFALSDKIQLNLQKLNYVTPTKIQDNAIALALEGKDIVGIANTGTGKTAAFLLPTIERILTKKARKCLIIAPTRELADQIEQELAKFAKGTGLSGALLIGGVPIGPQLRELSGKPDVIIGTPGRIKDHIERGSLQLDEIDIVVLDEVDRMLDMGFLPDIRLILELAPKTKQSLFFSATITKTIQDLIKTFTHDSIEIMARTAETSDNVEQAIVHYYHSDEKLEKLHTLLEFEKLEKALIFCETKRTTEQLSKQLLAKGHPADAMHGDKNQRQRERVLKNFKKGTVSILVATDVAARGIDVNGISHVINYDLPQTYEDYTHRIGRTGRGDNAVGYAFTFVEKRSF